MDNTKLTNFLLHKPLDLKQIATTLWINNEATKDLKMNLIKSTLSDFNPEFSQKIENSWNRLETRAKNNFPKNSPFVFYNAKVLNFEGISNNFHKDGLVNVSKGITYKTIASIRSNQDLYYKIDIKNKPCAFVIVSMLVTSDNKLVFGKRKYYGDWP